MALGVGVFGAEGGTEGVDVAEGHGEVLGVELARDGQVGGLAEEVLGVIHCAVLGSGRIIDVQGGDLEHFTSTLAVAGGDDGSVDVDEAAILEEAVDGVSGYAAHPEGGGEEVGSGAQVLDGAQELHAVALLLEGVIGGGCALYDHRFRLQLKGLLGVRGEHQLAGDDEGGADVLAGQFIVIGQGLFQNHLEVLEAAAVIEGQKAQVFHGTDGSRPTGHGDGLATEGGLVCVELCNSSTVHISSLQFKMDTACFRPDANQSSRLILV